MRSDVLAGIFFIAAITGAQAATVTQTITFTDVDYSGDTSLFTDIGVDFLSDPSPDLIFTLSFDPAVSPTTGPTPVLGGSLTAYGYNSFQVDIGGATITESPGDGSTDFVQVGDDLNISGTVRDILVIQAMSFPQINGISYNVRVELVGPNSTAFSGTNIPADTDSIINLLSGDIKAEVLLGGSSTTATAASSNAFLGAPAVIPLPASLPLMLAAFGGLAILRRRK